jgi:hypothetical protein
MNDGENEQKPGWPREVWIQKTYEAKAAEFGDDYNADDDDAVLFAMGESRRPLQIDSWAELKIPDGYELVGEDDRGDYDVYRESKRRG